ncbi:Canalicular multispecific organic anion transporter 2 [Nymphon striatum]|nr:Canalicular multispecific organic anion transporter 2 [Nymphon striatum]
MEKCLINNEKSDKQPNLFSKLFFTWTFPILRKGWKNNLKFEDYTEIPSNLKTKNLDKEFSKFYGIKKPSVWALIWTLFKISQNNVLTSWFCAILMITRITQQGFMKTNTGEIMNILTNDMNRFNSDFAYIFFVITSPLQCIIVCVILWINIGALPIIGMLGILIMIPLQILFGRSLFEFRKKVLKATDARIKLIYEIITSMKIIKLYAWEDSFWKHLIEKRNFVPDVANHVAFETFGKEAVSTIAKQLAVPLQTAKFDAERVHAEWLDLKVFVKRNPNFLSIEEYPSEYPSGMIQSLKEKMFIDSKYRPIVKLHEVSSSYGKKNIVKNISFELNPGDYLCVIGEVGSGKTSLLKTILKEMVVNDGVMKVRGTIAYACQQSWIFSDTLKNNILFGSKFDNERYKNIIKACCLSMDIQLMPNGDETVVGERGIKLSGGQRARVSLARALYYDADIYLLDDPLSAVDAEVGTIYILSTMVDSIMVEIASLRSHLEDAKGQLVKLISKDRIHKPDTVKYLNKSMKVALAKLSNIEKSVSEGATVVKERPSQPTYANVVAKAVASHRSPPETIIVESQDADIKTAGQLQALVKDSVNLREAKIGVTNIRHAGTKLIIKTQNSVDKGTLVNLINNTLKAKNKKPIYGTYETLLEKCPNLKTFFTESFKNPSTATKKIKGEQAIFKSKEVDGICKLDNIEEATSNSVSWKVYEEFFRAAGNPYLILLTSISLNIIYSLILLGFDYWIWTEFEDQKICLPGNCSTSTEHLGLSFNSQFQNNQNSLIILSIICLVSVLFSIPTIFFDIMFCLRAARKLHDRMFNKLLHAPIKFFNCHPIGEILNRFTKDIGEIDEYIPVGYQDFLQDTIKCIIMVLAVCFVEPYLFIVTILLAIPAVFAAKIYARSYTTLKRAENITKSPVYTHVSITLDGLSTIRAYGALDHFRIQFNNLQDLNMATYHMYYSVQIWLALYAEYIGTIMICVVTIMPVIFHSCKWLQLHSVDEKRLVKLNVSFSYFQLHQRVALDS